MEDSMPTIEVNGSALEYFESGSGTPLVLVHGSVNDHRAWEAQVAPLATRYHVITYSRRYHHPNPWVGDGSDYAVSLHAKDLAALVRALEITPAHLVGSSATSTPSSSSAVMVPAVSSVMRSGFHSRG
jgi:non-heme chloroperoxidase